MKKDYLSPEARLLCFFPREGIAADELSWGNYALTTASETVSGDYESNPEGTP